MVAYVTYKNNKTPKMSIVIPSLDGDRGGNVARLVKSIKDQSYKDVEIIIAVGEYPNGHARNVGFSKCSSTSEFLVFFDDDVSFNDENLLSKFEKALRISDHGLVGAAQQPPIGSTPFQLWLAYDLGKASISVQTTYKQSEMVTHAGMACRRDVWILHEGEDSTLVTGTDTDLRERIRQSGYKVVLVPETLVYHPLPKEVLSIFRGALRHGWHQFDYRMKHGFQGGKLPMFPKIKNSIKIVGLFIRELLIIFPHTFYANRDRRLGFRPINAIFRFLMSVGYLKRCFFEMQKKN